MATCKDCIHFVLCEKFGSIVDFDVSDGVCLYFSGREEYVKAEKYNDLRESFVDYVCSGEPTPALYCKNKNGMCVNGFGQCLPEYGNCQGFNPDGGGEKCG